jgi:MFS family permease
VTSTAPSPVSRVALEGIIAAIALVTLVGVGLALSIPLLSLEMERMGASGSEIGLNTAIAGFAAILTLPFAPRLAARIGVGPLIGLCIAITAISFLGFKLFFSYAAWFPIRFGFSVALGVLFVLSEFWITSTAPPERRGLIMGAYATALALGFAAGPMLLTLTGTSGWPPYVAAATIYGLALIPLGIGWRRLPRLDAAPKHPIARYLFAVPLATGAGFGFGAIETGAFSMLPVLGLRIGMDAAGAPALVSAMALGNVLFQLPIGLLADRLDKARLLMIMATVGVVGALLIPLMTGLAGAQGTWPLAWPLAWPLMGLLFIWGGIIGGIYVVGLAHLASRFAGPELAGANAAFVMLYNVGLLIGPPLTGLGLDRGMWSFATVLAAFSAVILLAGLVRR